MIYSSALVILQNNLVLINILGQAAEPSITLNGERDNSGGDYFCLEHTVTFDQEIGEVCEECGIVVLGVQDIWARDVRSSCPFYHA